MRAWLLMLALAGGCRGAEGEPVIGAAASLRGALPEVVEAFVRRSPGPRPIVSFGASGTLRQQVEGGAPIEVVVLAAAEPVDELIAAGLVEAGSRRVLAHNTLVLIGAGPLRFESIERLDPKERLAIGDPRTVPAGRYAQAALQSLGKWEAIEDRLVLGHDVSAVLAYVRRGEVRAGIVYATELEGVKDVEVLDRASVTAEVVAGATRDASPRARAFLDFLAGPAGRSILRAHGFAE